MKRLSTKTPKALLRKTYHWFTKTRRRKILSSFLALLILLSSIRIWYWFNPKKVKAATMQLTTTSSTVQIDVANRYRAIMQTGDTDDYLLIYDRAQNDSSPNPTHEFKGPCILETNTYCLRDDANRITTILESNAVRVRVRVEGKFNNEASTDYLDDESAAPILLTVIEDYTFTTEGVFVSNMTDFKTTGVTLDADSGHNGYEWLAVYSDVTDAAFNEGAIPDIIYGDGNTEVNNANQVDGVEFEDSNKYVVLPGTTGYQYGFVGIQGAGWFDGNATAAVDEWNWDENETSSGGTTQDLIAAQEQNGSTATLGKHYAKWFFLMLASGDLDSEDEREAYINDFRNPDILDFTTGDEWSFEDDSDLEGFWKMEEDGSTAAADSSSRGNNLTVSASDTIPRSTDAREGTYSRDFEYDDLDFMSLADGSQQGLDVSGDLTLSLWVKPEDALTVRLIDKSTSFNNNVAYSLGYDSSMNLYFAVSSAGNNQVELKPGASEITRGAWQHVVAVVDVDKALTFYINNIGVGSTAYTLGSIYNSSADFSLGGRAGTAYSDYLLDEVAVFSRALSLVEIDQIYKQGIKSHYNQAEAIYTVDAAGSQIELDIDGGSNVSNTLAGAESAGDTSIILTSSDDFPDGGGST
ncbi:LamG domain-containing protein, partial [Patescibacteria group bacterium]|nr:LamG domain-containing protein [Patescibacteria group bacterium]